MIAICNKSKFNFKKNERYNIEGIYSIFEKNDFISLNINNSTYRFRLNKSTDYVDNYIGENELYFYDYFTILNEDRKNKINKINNL